jgi:hypothetical protein
MNVDFMVAIMVQSVLNDLRWPSFETFVSFHDANVTA